MSAAEGQIKNGLTQIAVAVRSGDAFQYSGALALFCTGAIGSLITQVGMFASWQNFWASIVVAFVLNLSVALLVVAAYAIWIEPGRRSSVSLLLMFAAGIGAVRIWLSHQFQHSVGLPTLVRSDLSYLMGAAQGLIWFIAMSLLFHNAKRFAAERSRLVRQLAENRLRERRRTVIADTLTKELAGTVTEQVAKSVSQTRSSLAEALTYQDSAAALRSLAAALRTSIDRDIRPMSRELWMRNVARDSGLTWRMLLRVSCYERPFPLALIAIMSLGLGLPLSLALPQWRTAVPVDILQVGLVVTVLGLLDRYWRKPGANRYWGSLAIVPVVLLLPSMGVATLGWSAAYTDYWFVSGLIGMPLLVLFSGIVSGIALTREALLEQVRKSVDEAEVAQEVSERELHVASQRLARHLHSSLQGRLMAISLELEQAADAGQSDAMTQVLERLDQLLEAPLVGAFESGNVDVEEALRTLMQEWSAVAEVSLDYRPSWSGPLGHGDLVVGIVEEGIANAVRHGHASRIALQVVGEGSDAVITIRNDGEATPVGPAGLGTHWLDQVSRADWTLQPLPEGGMQLQVRLPDVVAGVNS